MSPRSPRFRGPAPVRAGDVLPRVLARFGLADELARWRAVVEWPEIVGERLASHTEARSVDRHTLWVEVESPAWMHELTYLKRELLARVEARLRARTIHELRFTLRGN